MGEVAETEGGGFLAKEGEIGEVEAADEEAAAWTKAGYVAGHVGKEDVSVDVGKDDVVGTTLSRQQRGITTKNVYKVNKSTSGRVNMLQSDVVAGIVGTSLVDVDGVGMPGATHASEDGQNARTTAHIEDVLADEVGIENVGHHQAGGLVMTCAKSHLGVDDDVVLGLRIVGMEGAVDDSTPINHDGLEEIPLPLLVPILILHRRGGERNSRSGHWERLQYLPESWLVVLLRRNIALHAIRCGDKAVEADIGRQRGYEVTCCLAVRSDDERHFRVLHFCFVLAG